MKKLVCCLLCFTQFAFAQLVVVDKQNQLPNDTAELYLDLMKRCLLNTIYEDQNVNPNYNEQARENGRDWPLLAHTMVGMKRLDNIQYCVKRVLENNIPGDLIETGVWRGGATIFMRAILKAYGDQNRRVWVVDSFAGLPPPNPEKYPADKGFDLSHVTVLAVSLENVQSNFAKYGLLDSQVVFLKGLFSQTLPTAPIESIAVLRLDGDLYESTMDALENLYPKVSIGGYIIIDDYGAIVPCKQAVHDFRNAHNITDPLVSIDWTGVFWQKTK
jgi:hypothetical protein